MQSSSSVTAASTSVPLGILFPAQLTVNRHSFKWTNYKRSRIQVLSQFSTVSHTYHQCELTQSIDTQKHVTEEELPEIKPK